MQRTKNQIRLDFASDIKFTEFCILVFSFLRKVLNISDEDFFKIEISLREVINNAVIHGNKSDPEKRVYVTFTWSKSRLWMSIRDENPEKVDFDKIDAKLRENDLLSFNGRGILIMKSYMDRVKFMPSENGTEIVMEKQI